jgi:hypothetical protein
MDNQQSGSSTNMLGAAEQAVSHGVWKPTKPRIYKI